MFSHTTIRVIAKILFMQVLLALALLTGLSLLVLRQVRQYQRDQALLTAIKHNDTLRVKACLQAGADANASDPMDESASIASVWKHWSGKLVGSEAELKAAARLPALLVAFNPDWQNGAKSLTQDHSIPENVALVKALLDAGGALRARDQYGWTALLYAAYAGHEKTVRLLLERGADVNVRAVNGSTPLICAPSGQSNGVAKMLLEYGALVNARDAKGATALHYAVVLGDKPTVEELLRYHADTQIRDASGNSPLQLARHYKALGIGEEQVTNIIALLQQAGARE